MRRKPKPKNKHLETFQRENSHAVDRLATAHAFMNDGALITAARYFREVADHLEKAQAARNTWVESNLG